jgi:hypothetical protein
MKLPRVSIGGLMFGVAMVCIPMALVINLMNGHDLLPPESRGDIGLWPTLTSFSISTRSLLRNRGKNSSFLVGFTWTGWALVVLYIVVSFWIPWLIQMQSDSAYVFLFTWFEFLRRGQVEGVVMLLAHGLILAIPQFMIAAFGGLIARLCRGKRWTTT